MSSITDLYIQLFGKTHIKDGDVIEMSEHGRAGGVSSGDGFKTVRKVEEKTLIDEPDSTITYVGKAAMGSATSDTVWQIKRISVSGTVTTISYADGVSNYTKEWDERTNYSYS